LRPVRVGERGSEELGRGEGKEVTMLTVTVPAVLLDLGLLGGPRTQSESSEVLDELYYEGLD